MQYDPIIHIISTASPTTSLCIVPTATPLGGHNTCQPQGATRSARTNNVDAEHAAVLVGFPSFVFPTSTSMFMLSLCFSTQFPPPIPLFTRLASPTLPIPHANIFRVTLERKRTEPRAIDQRGGGPNDSMNTKVRTRGRWSSAFGTHVGTYPPPPAPHNKSPTKAYQIPTILKIDMYNACAVSSHSQVATYVESETP